MGEEQQGSAYPTNQTISETAYAAKSRLASGESPDRPPTAYESAIQELDNEIGMALELFTDLTTKIAPVLRDEPQKEGDNQAVDQSYSTRVARDISDRAARLRKLRIAIRMVNNLVDL